MIGYRKTFGRIISPKGRQIRGRWGSITKERNLVWLKLEIMSLTISLMMSSEVLSAKLCKKPELSSIVAMSDASVS